jgi:lysophospholipase L1-like esterase
MTVALVASLGLLAVAITTVALSQESTPVEASGTVPSTSPVAGVLDAGNAESEITDINTDSDRPMVTFLGDSYTSGSRQDSGVESRYPHLLGEALDVSVHSAGLGGAGYVTQGTSKKALPSLVSKIHVDSDVVVVFGGRNDKVGYQPVHDAAAAMFTQIRDRFPDARLVVVGPTWPTSGTPDFVAESNRAIQDAAVANGATFVDAVDWLKADPGLVGDDKVHPSDAGHARLAELLEPVVQSALQP